MHIESTTQTYLGNEIRCAHIVADEVCTWRFEKVLDVDGAYAWQFVIKADSEKTVTVLCGDQEQAFSVNDAFQHLTKVFHDVTIGDHPHVDVEFPVGEYYIGRTQLEHGTIVTDWQISMDDTASEVSKMWSSITQTKEEIRAEVRADYMVHNLVPTEYSRYQTSGKTWKPSNGTVGIKWITNDDGSVKVELLSGYTQTTAQSAYAVTNYTLGGTASPIQLDPLKRYTISGCPSGGSNTSYFIRVRLYTASDIPSDSITFVDDENQFYDFGEGLTLETGWQWMTVHLVIASGYELPAEGITFWPMVIEGETLKPYTPASKGDVSIWSTIQQTANKISLVVGGDNVVDGASIVAAINNQTLESIVTINANRIKLEGYTTINDAFSVDTEGNMIATGGTIGGWEINDRRLEKTVEVSGSTLRSGMQSLNSDNPNEWNAAFFAGCTTISGGNITENSAFYVRHNGELYCRKGTFGGQIQSIAPTTTTFGPFEENDNELVYNHIHGYTPIADITPYDIDKDGVLTQTDADLIGSAISKSGSHEIVQGTSVYINPDVNSQTEDIIRIKRTYSFADGTSDSDYIFGVGGYGIKTAGYIKAEKFFLGSHRLGYFDHIDVDVTVPSGTWTSAGSYGFSKKGIYIVTCVAQFGDNPNGYRELLFGSVGQQMDMNPVLEYRNARDFRVATDKGTDTTNDGLTTCRFTHFYDIQKDVGRIATSNTRYFWVYQNSGSDLTVMLRAYIMKISS